MKSLKLILTAVVLISVLAFGAYAATITVTDGNLKAAFAKLDLNEDNTIILASDVTYTLPGTHSGHLTYKGDTASIKYQFSANIQICGPTTFENLVLSGDQARAIYATGFPLEIKDTVTTSHDHTVYGGKWSGPIKGDTNIEIYGGNYSSIVGGGQSGDSNNPPCVIKGDTHVTVGGNVKVSGYIYGGGSGAAVEGNTYVTIGGSVNANLDVDNESTYCYVFAGGNNSPVQGSTYITFQDSARYSFLFGGGNGANGTVGGETHIYMNGGEVMNIYGGAQTAELNCNTNIYVNGGTVEGVLGGSFGANLNGNANIYVLGGTVTRRIYSGCYNDTSGTLSISFTSDNYVNGSTMLVLNSGASLITGSDTNRGIFAGSRTASSHTDEVNTIVYLNGSDYSSKVGEQGLIGSSTFKSFENYIVKAGTGGTIVSANEAGKIKVVPDFDKYGEINGTKYINEVATLASGTTTVTFATNYALTTVTAAQAANGIELSVAGTLNAAGKDLGEKIIASVYDETGRCLGCKLLSSAASAVFECETPAGKTYTVKYNVIAGFAKAFAPMAQVKTATVTFN